MNNSNIPVPGLQAPRQLPQIPEERTPSSCSNSWFLALLGFSFHTILSPNNNCSFINDRLRGLCLLFPKSFLGKTGKLDPKTHGSLCPQCSFFFFALGHLNTVALGARSAGWMPLAETKRPTRVVS